MTAEIADAWLPAFFMPEGSDAVWGDCLHRGAEKRDIGKPPLGVYAGGRVAIGEGIESYRDMSRPGICALCRRHGCEGEEFL